MMPRPEDYARENLQTRPRNARVSVKTRLPTKTKTHPHNCSLCPNRNASRYPLNEKEVRWLCPVCVKKALRKDDKEKPNFVKASKLR